MKITAEEMQIEIDAAYKKAGSNAYFANGFVSGFAFAKKSFEQSEKSAILFERNSDLLIENAKLRQQLKETQDHLNYIIERAKQLRKSLMEGL